MILEHSHHKQEHNNLLPDKMLPRDYETFLALLCPKSVKYKRTVWQRELLLIDVSGVFIEYVSLVNALITHLQSHQFVINLKLLCHKISTNCSFVLSNELLIYISKHSVNDPQSYTSQKFGFWLITVNSNYIWLSLHYSKWSQFIGFSWSLTRLSLSRILLPTYMTWIHAIRNYKLN